MDFDSLWLSTFNRIKSHFARYVVEVTPYQDLLNVATGSSSRHVSETSADTNFPCYDLTIHVPNAPRRSGNYDADTSHDG